MKTVNNKVFTIPNQSKDCAIIYRDTLRANGFMAGIVGPSAEFNYHTTFGGDYAVKLCYVGNSNGGNN